MTYLLRAHSIIGEDPVESLAVTLERVAIACRYIYRNNNLTDLYITVLHHQNDERFNTTRLHKIKGILCVPYAHEMVNGQVLISAMILPDYKMVAYPFGAPKPLDSFDFKGLHDKWCSMMLPNAKIYWEETLPREIDETLKEFENIDIDIRR